jgi:hypothetical protein
MRRKRGVGVGRKGDEGKNASEEGVCVMREEQGGRTLTALGLTSYYLIVILPGRLARGDMMLGRERKESDRER